MGSCRTARTQHDAGTLQGFGAHVLQNDRTLALVVI